MLRRGYPQKALLIVLAVAGALFACGLPGGFLLDDFGSLSGLGMVRDGSRLAGIYVMEGVTGFPGRPLSYLAFVFQSGSWPDDPQAFKIANIVLHLVNGALVFALVARLIALRGRADAAWIGLLAATVWLVHPIQVSTVLYVVQRMTELAALFCLCGFLAYLHGRALAAAGRVRVGYVWMTAAVALGTPLAILAKENGALLPAYIAVIEFTVLAGLARPPRWNLWAAVFLAFPPLALAAYLALAPGWMDGYSIRAFGMSERLYTEAGILWDYLAKIALPRPRAFGIYFDDYPVALAPWSSLSTAAALAGWGAALLGAVAWRRSLPFLSFAVLWFLAGHLLESTVIPLELYFEHRNYLPLLGPAVAIAWAAKRLWDAASAPYVRRAYALLGLAAALALGGVTWVEARAWADPVRQVALWARERPESQRAQYALGMQYFFARRYAEASETLERAQAMAPQEAYFALARLAIGCLTDGVPIPEAGAVAGSLARTPVRPVVTELLNGIVVQLERGDCRRIRAEDALALADGFLSNPKVGGIYRWAGLYVKGRVHAVQGDLDPAVRALEAANDILPNLGVLHQQVTWLVSAALYDDALRFIEKGRGDPRWRPWQRALYAGYFEAWEREVREAARRKGAAVQGGS
jgi:tetratricopeptide (TPR) repeat protein